MGLWLLSRSGCHLCEQMVEQLLTEFPVLASRITVLEVDGRPEWRRYGMKIPVLLDAQDGSAVCVTVFDREAVAEWLADRSN